MAHVEDRSEPGKPRRWVAVWTEPGGRRRAESFRRKLDADNKIASVVSSMLRREWVDPDAGKLTLGEYAKLWAETRAVRDTTRKQYDYAIGCLDVLARVALAQLTPSVMEQWQAGLLARDLAPSTVCTVRATVNAILRTAVRDQRIVANPLDGVRKPEVPRKRVTPFERATVRHIHENITAWYRPAVLLGALCGLRRGEAFGLCRDRVDFDARLIVVDRALKYTPGRGLHLGPPKTASSVRDVPMPRPVAEALAGHMLRYGTRDSDGLIFRTRGGQPVDAGILADAWRRVAPAGSRFHDLRHYYASVLIEQGASPVEVQERLGHATVEEVNTYAHLFRYTAERSRTRVEDAWNAPDAEDGDAAGEAARS
ncbi:MAG TPA: site-specific integrase [Jatrophihabitans sp.]|nr:site-specific integrase [Jatrophihabitans sp.]